MTAGPLPPPEPANCADESSDDEIDSEKDEEEESILPPIVHHQPGRSRKERTEAEKERRFRRGIIQRIQKCRLCRAVGHSKRTCKGPPV
jgi:hypothetical protein